MLSNNAGRQRVNTACSWHCSRQCVELSLSSLM